MDPLVIFNESDHTYWKRSDKPGSERIRLESVSGLYKDYIPPFNEEFSAKRNVIKLQFPEQYFLIKEKIKSRHRKGYKWWEDPELPNMFYDQVLLEELSSKILEEWSERGAISRKRGTAFHKKQELLDYGIGQVVNEYTNTAFQSWNIAKQFDNQSLADNLFSIPDGYYPELLIFNTEYGLAGQEDRVFIKTVGKRRLVWCGDWKTDAEIKFEPDFFTEKLYPPVDHLDNLSGLKYALKGSTYAWMLEQFGFEVAGVSISHVNINDDLEIVKKEFHKLPYLKKEVVNILDDWSLKKKTK